MKCKSVAIKWAIVVGMVILVNLSMPNAIKQVVDVSEVTLRITATEAKSALDEDPHVIFLDVRTLKEHQEKYIEGSVFLPLDQLVDKVADVLPDQEAKIIVYCRSGNRSQTAMEQLVEMGYQNVYNLTGGIDQWPYAVMTK